AGSGPIYQLARVFRDGETGRRHNPEFSLLEWYRPGFDHFALMAEVEALLSLLLATPRGEYLSYQEVFRHYLDMDVFAAGIGVLGQLAKVHGLQETTAHLSSRQLYLDFLMMVIIEPHLGHERPCFVYNYPASEAQLARICPP